MADGLLNALWREMLSQSATATTEVSNNENEVCRRLILSAITIDQAGVITAPSLSFGTVSVPGGGTGDVTLASHGVLVGQGVSNVAVTTAGTTGQVLSGVTGGDPTFQSVLSGPLANQGTTTTVLHGNAGGTPAFGAIVNADITNATIDLAAKVTGTLPGANGGTGSANVTIAGPTVPRTLTVPDASTTVLTTNAAVTVAQGGTGVATLTSHGVLVGNAAGTVQATSAGTAGQVLTSNGAAADPTYQAANWTLLHSGSGTDTSAAANDVDTFAITGLTALDTLRAVFVIETVTQQTGQVFLRSATDAVSLGSWTNVAVIAAGVQVVGEMITRVRQGSTVNALSMTSAWSSTPADLSVPTVFTLTTAWTGSWTIALRHNGVTAGGTFKYSWSLYKMAGQ